MQPEPDLTGFVENGQIPDLPELVPKSGTSLPEDILACVNNTFDSL